MLSQFWVTVDQACNKRKSEARSQCSSNIEPKCKGASIIRADVDVAGVTSENLGVYGGVSKGNEALIAFVLKHHIYLI